MINGWINWQRLVSRRDSGHILNGRCSFPIRWNKEELWIDCYVLQFMGGLLEH